MNAVLIDKLIWLISNLISRMINIGRGRELSVHDEDRDIKGL